MTTLAQLQAQKAELEAKIAEALKNERKDAIAQVRSLVEAFELTEKEVFAKKGTRKASSPVAAKYKDKATGKTWSGRGREPKWLAGKNKADYAI